MEAGEGGTDCQACEALLGDRTVDDSFVAEAVEEAFRDLVAVATHISI